MTIRRARTMGVDRVAQELARRFNVPLWPMKVALEDAISGTSTEVELDRLFERLARR